MHWPASSVRACRLPAFVEQAPRMFQSKSGAQRSHGIPRQIHIVAPMAKAVLQFNVYPRQMQPRADDKKMSPKRTSSTKVDRPPLSAPRTSSKKSVQAMLSRGQSTGNLPSLASLEANDNSRPTTSPSRPTETAPPTESSTPAIEPSSPGKKSDPAEPLLSPSPSKAPPLKKSSSPTNGGSRSGSGGHRKNDPSPSKKHRRKKKKQQSHFPMADDYTGSSDNKLKGIDILKKKEKKSRRKSSSHSGDVKTDRSPLPKDNSI